MKVTPQCLSLSRPAPAKGASDVQIVQRPQQSQASKQRLERLKLREMQAFADRITSASQSGSVWNCERSRDVGILDIARVALGSDQ